MSGNALRIIFCVFLSVALTACGGGGGGGDGGSNTPLDTDKDGVADTQDAFPNDPKETKDTDKDGVGDNADAFPNDPKETKDTDKDGVGDNADAFPNDPKETKDTDKDGVGDNADVFPNDPAETVDTDKDGVGDNADTTPLGQAIPAWPTFQGNAKRSGWVDVTLTPGDFKPRWEKPLTMSTIQQGVAADGYIFINNGGVLHTLDARTGETLWTRTLVSSNSAFYIFLSSAYADGIIYVRIGGSTSSLRAFNAADGTLVFDVPLPYTSSQLPAPVVADGVIYVSDGSYNGVYALDAKTGVQKWWKTLYSYFPYALALSDNYLVSYILDSTPRLTVMNRLTGNIEFEIADTSFVWTGLFNTPTSTIAGDYVVVNYGSRLLAFNLATRQLVWQLAANTTGQPVVKGDRLFVINNGILEIHSLTDGSLMSAFNGASAFVGNPIVTNNLIFIRDDKNSYAYGLENSALAWTLTGKTGDFIIAEGALIVPYSTGVSAIDLDGDIDADGLPDWWEKRYKKNIYPTADVDNDGLTGLEEFTHSTNPLVADADGDKLLDGEEIANKTSPFKADTDGDGLDDYLEVKTHLTDPTKADTDGDSLRDGEEIAVGLDPLKAADATEDADNDGFSNLHEVRANTGIKDATSKPQMTEWTTQSGNQGRTGYVPQLLNHTRFSERWTISSPLSFYYPITASGKIVMRVGNTQLLALDNGTGEESWRTDISSSSTLVNSQDGKLWYLSGIGNGNFNLMSLDAANGNALLNKSLSNDSHYSVAPLVQGDKVYRVAGNRGFTAYSQSTGNLLWNSQYSTEYFPGDRLHLLGADHLIGIGDRSLNIFSASTGAYVKTISLASYFSISEAFLGTRGNVIARSNSTLMSITIADGITQWTRSDCPSSRTAVGNGNVYALGQSKLCVIDQQSGGLLWTLDLPANDWGISNLVATASHLFYSNSGKTYAIDLAQRAITWTLQKGGNELLMGADGTLYLFSNYNVTAVDTEGDTDEDSLPQWWERRYGGDLVASADPDGDELTNLEEYTAKTNPLVADTDGDTLKDGVEVKTTKTNPLVADTDKDGLSDAAEVNTHGSDPLVVDSDEDGIDDGKEIAAGLNPTDESDADEDSDSDGYTNRDEVLSGTNVADATSKPQVADWAMNQGNAAHSGFQPYRLDSDDFSVRWSKAFTQSLKPIVTGDKQVFVVPSMDYSDASMLYALNVVDGKEQWNKSFGAAYYNINSPVYNAGKVLVNSYNPHGMLAFDSRLGTELFKSEFNAGSGTSQLPVVAGSTAYYNLGYYGIQAKDLSSGLTLWTSSTIGNDNTNIAANNDYIFHSSDTGIVALERTTGAKAFTINTQSSEIADVVLGSRNNILSFQSGLTSFDIATRKINWRIPATSYYSNNVPAVGNGHVYYSNSTGLYSIDEVSGAQRWSWYPTEGGLSSNILVTLTHVFVASNNKTYALSVATGELEWTYSAGGKLALGSDGALYIQSDRQVIAINLEGDRDGDGLPDWWERHYGLNPEDDADAALDLDSDGLTNQEEFTHGSYADKADSDNDGLSDLDEIDTHHTNPTTTDSDNDGMDDGWEVDNSLDPLDPADRDQDSDNDQVPNFFEYLSGTDPHNAASLPPFFSAGTYSFEDAQLPAGWTLSVGTTDVSVSINNASHGTKSLQLRQQADIGFFGFFAASDLSLDIKSGCNETYPVSIYVDDQLMATQNAGSSWSTLKTVIPLGNHKVSIRSSSYSCALFLDKVVVAAATSNVGLGVQFVSLYDNFLQFVNVNGEVVRTVGAAAPAKNVTPRNLATLGNEKVAVIFSGNTRHLGLLDLQTLSWRYFDIQDQLASDYYYGRAGLVARGNYAYVPTLNTATNVPAISRINLTNGTITRFGSHQYNSIAVDASGAIYAHANGVVYKYDAASLTLLSQSNVLNATHILIDHLDRLIVASTNYEIVRYNAQRLVEARIQSLNSIAAMAVNERDELITADSGKLTWYSSDWQRSRTINLRANFIASFPQPDTDVDGMPDWWELAHSLNPIDPVDAASDDDADGLTALEEYVVDTNPAIDDTDGDLLIDGDEVNDFGTNPNLADTDGDGLSDSDEILTHLTDPLKSDTDGDTFSDLLEIIQFSTDPNDANSKPAALVNFQESFEVSAAGWLKPTAGDAGWSISSVSASNGVKSLRSDPIANNQTATVEWLGVFNQSTLTFDARVSSEYCCDYLIVYVDNQAVREVRDTQGLWKTESIAMTQGVHTVRFVYRKDGSGVQGLDSALIDNIRVQ